ncbi:sugar phosphate isomerase/epimerase family protein [Paenalcaligenes hermetiae]|uniref:sugar phosphate isomerase/epimerase family protein n=1 Tax=Paenalcaligenes hermetiae TaxID=1157987 RepID=UPI0031F0EF26
MVSTAREQQGRLLSRQGCPQRLLEEGPQLRAAIEAAGLVPFGTVPAMHTGTDEATWRLNFQAAAAAGARTVRLTPKAYPAGLFDYPAFLKEVVAAYERAIAIARPLGVKPVIEMHSGNLAITPGLALQIVEHFSPQDIGLILDLPNFAREGGVHPQLCLSVVRDYVDHCHLGGYRKNGGQYDAYGFRQNTGEMCALSESDLPIPRWIELLAELATPQRPIPLIIEDYSANISGELRLRRSVAEARRLPQLALPQIKRA